jgi:putative Mg2+ transporter-C (MgtC) family protein
MAGLAAFAHDEGFKMVLAIALGGLVGLERELLGKPAGLRTNILIALGSTVLTLTSLRLAGPLGDQGRVAAQVVSGVGFIGAGTILQARGAVIGLTSAATIWAVAAIGIAVGADMPLVSVGATLAILVCLVGLRRVEYFSYGRRELVTFDLRLSDSSGLSDLTDIFGNAGVLIEHSSVHKTSAGIDFTVACNTDPRTASSLLAGLIMREDVQSATYSQ